MTSPLLHFEFADASGTVRPLRFTDPVEVVIATRVEEVLPALRRVGQAVAEGLYAAGYIGYEAAPAFDPAFRVRHGGALPLLWFGLFRAPDSQANQEPGGPFQLTEWQPSVTREAYDAAIHAIREAIARGETYQVNHTLRLRARFAGDDWSFYRALCAAQRPGYGAYLNLGRHRILSASPELFFHRSGDRITVRPMKGTRPRGRFPAEDATLRAALAASEKERAENLMIVDLMRNDLGRIARTGSVQVTRLFDVETYPTVLQMTSTVTAEPREGTSLVDLFRALFPCGSITGAPKVSTMRLITVLEDSPRGAYCGAMGYVTPAGEAVFNVAIRTVVLDADTGAVEYGVGGGITWDSDAGGEYAETVAKAAILTVARPPFRLLETLRLENGQYALLERHLDRLLQSAEYFGIPVQSSHVRDALQRFLTAHAVGAWRVRLLASGVGAVEVEGTPLVELPPSPLPIALANQPVSRRDVFLFHKTTHRRVYEEQKAAHQQAFDVLLWNEERELTEFTTGNLVLKLEGQHWTPPVECGLLAGTFRAELLARGEIRERVLTCEDLQRAECVWYINGVRSWVPVQVQSSGRG